MIDVWISWKDTVDPQACNTNSSVYWKFSRDPERTPFQWDDSTSAGFSKNNKTWLPIGPDYKEVNVAKEETSQNSHLKVYKALMKLRQTDTLKYGESYVEALNQNVFAILRRLQSADKYITLMNIWNEVETVDITQLDAFEHSLSYEVVDTLSGHIPGELVDPKKVILQPKESFVLKYSLTEYEKFYDDYKYQLVIQNGN